MRWWSTALAVLFLTSCSGGEAREPTPGVPEKVAADVERLAVALEQVLRGGRYPVNLAQALAVLEDAGLEPTMGLEVAGYVYDPELVEFTLCVQDSAGAYATYDTAPMSLRESGVSGGCAQAKTLQSAQ